MRPLPPVKQIPLDEPLQPDPGAAARDRWYAIVLSLIVVMLVIFSFLGGWAMCDWYHHRQILHF